MLSFSAAPFSGFNLLFRRQLFRKQLSTVPGLLDKKGGRKIPSLFHLCLIKDGTVFPLFCPTNPTQHPLIICPFLFSCLVRFLTKEVESLLGFF
jgi:hypothetical protein